MRDWICETNTGVLNRTPVFLWIGLTKTGGTLDAFVEAAREEAQKLNVSIADAYRVWNQLERSGADTTALLANAINHPIPEMHELFAEKIVEQVLG